MTRTSVEAGVDRGSAIEAPALSELTICFGLDVSATSFADGNTACRSLISPTPNWSTSTTIT